MFALHIIVGLNIGGAELMLRRLVVSHLNHPHMRHAIVSLTTVGPIGQQLQQQHVDVYALNMKGIGDIWRVLCRLRQLIESLRPDIVQTWMYHADFLGGLAARVAGVKNIIWGVRTTEVNAAGFGATALVRKACAWLSSTVPRFIVCAAEASRKAHIAVGYDASRMVVIPNGFDLARFVPMPDRRDALRLQCGFDVGAVVVGYVGRFHPVKDQANFVRAAGLSAASHPNARFLMVGRDLDAANAQLQSWIKDTGHADRFVLLGERSDVPVCLAAMDVFCLSSRTEGFPNVVGEAMAMGLTCVVTDVGDAAMLVADTGVVVPKEDSVALAAGLGKLLSMPSAEREQAGQRAKARIHSKFSMDLAREQFEAIYEQMTRKEPN